jgi:hypothetical protein
MSRHEPALETDDVVRLLEPSMQLGVEVVLAAHEHLVDAPPGAVADRPEDPGILDPPVQREGDDEPGAGRG